MSDKLLPSISNQDVVHVEQKKIPVLKTRMSPSGIRYSPLGVGIVALLACVSVYYVFIKSDPNPAMDEVSLRALLIAGIDFAERGGDKVREVKKANNLNEESKGETKEGANDPLTLGDRMSHQAITASFAMTFPGVPMISEEKDGKLLGIDIKPAPTENEEVSKYVKGPDEVVESKDVTIWVDPLDATQEYTENLLQYVTTMVCVAVKGRPVIGIIHKPFEGKTFWSWVGHGSNIEEVHIGNEAEHRIIVSRSHAGRVETTAKNAFGKDAHVVPAGGAGFKSLALFNGKASVYIHTTLIKKWDICAGNAILDHAGGKMTTLAGGRIDYSAKKDPKNEGGLLAALHDHSKYLAKLGYA